MPAQGEETQTYRARKYGATPEDTMRVQANLTKLGAEFGFKFDFFEKMKLVNTRNVHILLNNAKKFGLQTQLNLRLAKAFYGERKDISNREILKQELESVGLNADDALAKLDDIQAQKQVQKKESHWQNLGVTGVPTMIFNSSSALSGARSVNSYKQVLAELLKQLQTMKT